MKTQALRRFRQKLAANEPVFGLWVTLESASITEMAVALGLDWVVIDIEHGHLDWREVLEHVRATVRSDTVVLVRVLDRDKGIIKRALDIGADGILIPWVESAEELRQAIGFARYPLEGERGIGGERATCWGQCLAQHVEEANENVLVIPIIESVKGGENISQMLSVPGLEVVFFGPSDYSSSAGFAGQWEGPGVADKILSIKDKILAAGKHCGLIATDNNNLKQRIAEGFRMLATGLDGGLLIRCLRASLATVGRDSTMNPALDPAYNTPAGSGGGGYGTGQAAGQPQTAQPPSSIATDIAPGVCFAETFQTTNGDVNMTAGTITIDRGATLPYHYHSFDESVTLLTGDAIVEVEGRMYTLNPLETITIPAGLTHSAMNRSKQQSAVFHIAMATDRPERTFVDRFFSRKGMASDSTGQDGAERVLRQS